MKQASSYGIRTIEFDGEKYPLFQSEGFAAQYAFPFALKVCKGIGYDIGCGKEEWKLPGAIGIDQHLSDERCKNALKLPDIMVNFIFSSHCLEHLPDWVRALDHWSSRLKSGGVMFLYLPDYSQKYWRPWHNTKHVNILNAMVICGYFKDNGFKNIFASGVDLYNSFMVMAEKI